VAAKQNSGKNSTSFGRIGLGVEIKLVIVCPR